MSNNKNDGLRATLSEKGQVTIPKEIRDELGLVPGTILIFYPQSGKLIGQKDHEQIPKGKWKRRGKLPKGLNVDSYLATVRDADRS